MMPPPVAPTSWGSTKSGTTHDPLCPSVVKPMLSAVSCTFCEVIAVTRNDEQTKLHPIDLTLMNREYARGRRDAAHAVEDYVYGGIHRQVTNAGIIAAARGNA